MKDVRFVLKRYYTGDELPVKGQVAVMRSITNQRR